MRLDLLELIKKEKALTHIFILSYGIDLFFIQSKLIPGLKQCGHPKLTIFADAERVIESYSYLHDWVSGIGSRYRLIPVPMQPGYSFHPKAVLLISDTKATLFIGSGNLGFAGWKENAEIWCKIDSEVEGTAPIMWFRQFLNEIISTVPLNEPLIKEVDVAFNAEIKSWASINSGVNTLIGRMNIGPSIINQINTYFKDRKMDLITVCAPFFDKEGTALQMLSRGRGDPNVDVLIQSKRSTLRKNAVDKFPSNIRVKNIELSQKDSDKISRFIHAKFYAFENGEDIVLICGSANCSHSALNVNKNNSNCELLNIINTTKTDFYENIIGELNFIEQEPELKPDETEEIQETPFIKITILAARFFDGPLKIAFSDNGSVVIKECIIDDKRSDFTITSPGIITAQLPSCPKIVQLIGDSTGQKVESIKFWVDNEFELSTTPSQRRIAESIVKNVNIDSWTSKGWLEIAKLIQNELKISPLARESHKTTTIDKPEKELSFSYNDWFSSEFQVPRIVKYVNANNRNDRISSLRLLLLRVLGVSVSLHEPDEKKKEKEEKDNVSEDDDAAVDSETELVTKPARKQKVIKKHDELKNAKKYTENIIKRLISEEYLKSVSAVVLKRDLQIAGILLITGVIEKWLNEEDFITYTYDLWSCLFFSTKEKDSTIGWIEKKINESEEPDLFKVEFSDSQMAVVLAIWALLVVDNKQDISKTALFRLACVNSVARFPWLWHPTASINIFELLQNYLLTLGYKLEDDKWVEIQKSWIQLINQGRALFKFGKLISGETVEYYKDLIKRENLKKGEILFQGNEFGFCVLLRNASRSIRSYTEVSSLFDSTREIKIGNEYLIPIYDLIDTSNTFINYINEEDVISMKELVESLAPGLKNIVTSEIIQKEK